MKIKFYTNQILTLYNIHGNQKTKNKNQDKQKENK